MFRSDYWEGTKPYVETETGVSGFAAGVSIYSNSQSYLATNGGITYHSSEQVSVSLEDRLKQFTIEWMRAVRYSSFLIDLETNPAYLNIIEIGKPALPFIFDDLRNSQPKPWFIALRKITGVNPIKEDNAGHVPSMTKVWLQWAQDNGL